MRCPRCQRLSPDDAVFCPGCGAPLAFRAEPAPRPLDVSVSLDRRAAGREPDVEPPAAARPSPWDLPPHGERSEAGLDGGALTLEIDPDDFRFGPVPELAPDLEAALVAGLDAAPSETDFAWEAAAPPRRPLDTDRARPLERALGLAEDPVVPGDLGLAPGGGRGAILDLVAPREDPAGAALDRDLDLGGFPGGQAAPSRPAEDDRPLGPAASTGAPVDGHPLDVALDLGREPAASPLGLPLPAVARPDQLRLPLARAAPAARPGRRAAAWAVDAAPFVALAAVAIASVYARVPLSPGDRAGTAELVLRDGGALASPLVACVAILGLVYQTLAHALAGATLGKRLLGLRVVDLEGDRPSFGRSAARAALSAASVLLLGLGLLPALFTRSGRALHDISSGTRVVESP